MPPIAVHAQGTITPRSTTNSMNALRSHMCAELDIHERVLMTVSAFFTASTLRTTMALSPLGAVMMVDMEPALDGSGGKELGVGALTKGVIDLSITDTSPRPGVSTMGSMGTGSRGDGGVVSFGGARRELLDIKLCLSFFFL